MAIAEADTMELVVAVHERRVVAEPGGLDQLERPRPECPVRRSPAGWARTGNPFNGLYAPVEDCPLLIRRQLAEVLVEPAVAG